MANDGILQVNGFGHGTQQRLKPRLKLKVSNSLTERQIARRAATEDDEDDSSEWSNVGQDVFDFSLLRMKLQNRIMGSEIYIQKNGIHLKFAD